MLDTKNVTRVYNGKLGACMCGCSGKYSTASAYRDVVSKERGYPVSDEEVSDRSVKIIAKRVLFNPNAKWDTDHSCVILEDKTAGYAGKIQVVWFK
jgi:hypothetical protein